MQEWWLLAPGLAALCILVREDARKNLVDFLSSRPMGPDDDWPETRVKATLEACARIIAYEHERKERLRLYESNWSRTNFRVVR